MFLLSDLLQVTELTQFLIENCEILGENIPNLLDTDEGTFMYLFTSLKSSIIVSPISIIRDCVTVCDCRDSPFDFHNILPHNFLS